MNFNILAAAVLFAAVAVNNPFVAIVTFGGALLARRLFTNNSHREENAWSP